MGHFTSVDSSALASIDKNGFALFRHFFNKQYVNVIRQHISRYVDSAYPGVIRDKDGVTLRGIHGPHLHDDFFKSLAKNQRLVAIAAKILGDTAYLHQFKVNVRQKLIGDRWPWHEDLVYWKQKSKSEPIKLVTIALLIDDSDLVSGPSRYLRNVNKRVTHCQSNNKHLHNGDQSDILATDIAEKWGIEPVIGRAGDLLIFDPFIADSTAANFSSYNRRLLILTFAAGNEAGNEIG